MQLDQIHTLFDYHWTTTERLLENVVRLPPERHTAPPEHGSRSLHSLLFHILAADRGWRIGLETGTQQPGLRIEEHHGLQAVASLLTQEKRAWEAYLSELSDRALNEDVTLVTLRGHSRTFPLWRILLHLILHGMQHHAEIGQALSEMDASPGDIDFIFFSG